jgi:hypothetical protein
MNSWCSPNRIFLHHLPDKSANIIIDFGPAEVLASRSERPDQTKSGTVLGDNSFRFDDNQDVAP